MAVFRHGDHDAFFDGVTTYNASTNLVGGVNVPGSGSVSKAIEIGRGGDNFSFYVRVTSAPAFASTWLLQVAHSGDPSVEGNVDVDPSTNAYVWHDAWYLGTSGSGNSTRIEVTVPSGGGAVMSFVPDFAAGWARLKRTDTNGNVTVIAGFEVQGD